MFSFMLLPSRSVWMSGNVRIEAVKQHTDKPVAMRWMRIADGSRYDPNRDTSEDPKLEKHMDL